MKVQMWPAVLRISCVCETDTGLMTNIHLRAESELPLILKQLMTSTVKCHHHKMIQHLSQWLLPAFSFSRIPGYVTSRWWASDCFQWEVVDILWQKTYPIVPLLIKVPQIQYNWVWWRTPVSMYHLTFPVNLGTPSVGRPDLTNESSEHPVKFEFQRNSTSCFSVSQSQI